MRVMGEVWGVVATHSTSRWKERRREDMASSCLLRSADGTTSSRLEGRKMAARRMQTGTVGLLTSLAFERLLDRPGAPLLRQDLDPLRI